MVAKNAPSGSYVAGCPAYNPEKGYSVPDGKPRNCKACERTA